MTTTTTKTDRYSNRAPRGGAVSLVNGVFYAGGRFMPMAPAEFKAGPVALMGSSRQVAWANRIRREELARIGQDIEVRRMFLSDAKVIDATGVRRGILRDEVARYTLMTERSAGRIIELRAAGF